ncbi:MAG: hypothetical protein Q9M91_00480 [Candidatus Dojkabacteria bacterium]|nr:hypothetical protein [Candidatus Dojkabacteria bacterium]
MIKPTEKKGTFMSFLDQRGLTEKGGREQRLSEITEKIRNTSKLVLKELNAYFLNDPSTVVSSNNFNKIDEILDQTIDIWEKFNFPFQDMVYIRTAWFNKTIQFNFPFQTFKRDKKCTKRNKIFFR